MIDLNLFKLSKDELCDSLIDNRLRPHNFGTIDVRLCGEIIESMGIMYEVGFTHGAVAKELPPVSVPSTKKDFDDFCKGLTGTSRSQLMWLYYESQAQYKGATIRAEIAESELVKVQADYRNACANVRDARAQPKIAEHNFSLNCAFLGHTEVHCAGCCAEQQAGNIVLKGWKCSACGCFNGEEKERRSECRACGLARKT